MVRFKQFFIVVFLPLAFSLFIYIFFRPASTGINLFIENFIGLDSLQRYRSTITSFYLPSDFVIQTLPGGLWILSITALTLGVFFVKNKLGKRLLALPLVYGLGLELCQKMDWTDGTFDWLDVWIVPVAWIGGLLLGYLLFRKKPLPVQLGLGLVLFGFLSLIMGDCF